MLDAWAIASSEGLLLGTQEGSIEEARAHAQRIVGPQGAVYLDGLMRVYDLGADGFDERRPRESAPPPALAANVKTKLHVLAQTAPFSEQPELAMRALGLRWPVNTDEVLALDLDEAYETIQPFFDDLPPQFPNFPNRKKVRWQPDTLRPSRRRGEPAGVTGALDSSAEGMLGGNYKMDKKDARQKFARAKGLSLAPNVLSFLGADRPFRGETLCLRSTPECMAVCLVYTGHNVSGTYPNALKVAKAKAFLSEPLAFCRMLYAGIDQWSCTQLALGYEPFIRLNVYSDIPWELFWPELFDEFPQIQFFDYTKVPGRTSLPENYDLTFSYSGTNREDTIHEVTVLNRRVAAVFLTVDGRIPAFWRDREGRGPGLRVVDGDQSDLRPLDPPNEDDDTPVCVGLHYKPPKIGKEKSAKRTRQAMKAFIIPCEKNDDGSVTVTVAPQHTFALYEGSEEEETA